MRLKVELNPKYVEVAGKYQDSLLGVVVVTPEISEDYWLLRVPVSASQAVVCFPKCCTIGIGFQYGISSNRNLPADVLAQHIYEHIRDNNLFIEEFDPETDPWEVCVKAIRLLQREVRRRFDPDRQTFDMRKKVVKSNQNSRSAARRKR